MGDALGSVGVITAGLLMRFKGWTLADPLASMFIGLLIAISSWTLVKQSVNVLLEGTPTHLDAATIARAIQQIDGVQAVHDLHLWTITTGMEAMSGTPEAFAARIKSETEKTAKVVRESGMRLN